MQNKVWLSVTTQNLLKLLLIKIYRVGLHHCSNNLVVFACGQVDITVENEFFVGSRIEDAE